METVQERELLQLQGWPFHTMAASLDASSGYSGSCSGGGGGDSFSLLGWEPPFGCFGVVDADAHLHDLFPLCMESLPVSPAASTAAAIPPEPQDAVAMPEELNDLLLNFWDASSYGDANEQQPRQQVLQHEKSCSNNAATATTTTSSSFLYDDDPLGSIFSRGPTLPEEAAFQAQAPAEPLRSSSSSSSHADPQVSDVSGAWTQDATTEPSGRGARPPPLPRRCSPSLLKRATPEGADHLATRHDTTHLTVASTYRPQFSGRLRVINVGFTLSSRGGGGGGVEREQRQAAAEGGVGVGRQGGVPVRGAETRRARRRRDAGRHQRADPHAAGAACAAPRRRVRVRAARPLGRWAGHIGQGRLRLHEAAHPRARHHYHHKDARLMPCNHARMLPCVLSSCTGEVMV